jgi:predicted dehydrogenase
MRFAPNVRKLRRLLADGYTGSVRHAHLRLLIDRWIDARRPYSWWHDRTRGGGVLAALGSHGIDLLRWLFGEIVSAQGTLRTCVRERPVAGELRLARVDADDLAAVTLEHADGVLSTMLLSVVAHRGPKFRFEVYGSQGTLLLDEDGGLWGSRREAPAGEAAAPFEALSEPETFESAAQKSLPDSPWARSFASCVHELVPALAEGAPVPADAARFEDGCAVQSVLDQLRQ